MKNTESNATTSAYTKNPRSENEHSVDETVVQQSVDPPPAYDNTSNDPAKQSQAAPPVTPQVTQIVTVMQPKLGSLPVQCTCSKCHQSIVSRTELSNGLAVWAACLVLVIVGCWLGCCLIPFCVDDLKDVTHHCPNCNTVLVSLAHSMSTATVNIVRIPAAKENAEDEILECLRRDGVAVVTGMYTRSHVEQVKQDLAPHFDCDKIDQSGFFPSTTQRAMGFFAISRACIDMAMNPLLLAVANRLLTSTYTFYVGSEKKTVQSKPVISSTVGFRINPGGQQQELHRDDTDFHARPCDWPMMIGCVIALTRTHKNNGATLVIPGSHLWEDSNRAPLVEEAVPAELEPGDAAIFVGNLYHAGGSNLTVDERREIAGIFMSKGFYRQAENEYLAVPPERCKELQLSSAELRVLGYGISQPACGFFKYKDPMESVFGIVDDETVIL
ncbi:unnamed protein product [Rotaria magnacalcarata]|uniref:LITAF domain-containing protein n=1 Tax=Rotaria magnacalcarata TaxID=392030 RepID=A0A816P3B0_9BILA|nr:unnamed protein product [Rotaria magnacalcarata]